MSTTADQVDFQFCINEDLSITKDPPSPWRFGRPGTSWRIRVVNNTDRDHTVAMRNFRHPDGGGVVPVSGVRTWRVFQRQPSRITTLKVLDVGHYQTFTYDILLNDQIAQDPELIVDEPPRDKPPKKAKKASGSRKAAKGGKAAVKSSAKKGPAKRVAKKAAKKTANKTAKKAARKAAKKKR